ncbi:MAG: hypothetical protein IKF99_05635 [Oscillospiraceae bacterium]|nr:hypothetical protein [Oscillospiraceae bacterium]
MRFYENGREIKRYKNIEIPDAIKELEFTGFKFDVPKSGPITFKIYFKPGTLPETWPDARQRKTRTPKAADPEPMAEEPAQNAIEAEETALTAAMDQAREEGQPVDEITQAAAQGTEITTEIIDAADDGHEIIITAEDDPQDDPQPETMTVHYDVPGSARKALANAIGEAIGAYPAYQAAPTFAYIIGEYTLDRQGILTGPHNAYLLGFLAQDGYQTKQKTTTTIPAILMPGVVVKALDILLLSGNVRNPHTGISQSVLHFCEVILFPQISGIGWLLLFPHLVWNSDQFGHCAVLRRA